MTPMIKYLLIINTGVFLFQQVLPRDFVIYFGLVPRLISHQFFIWQFLTYMFLHGGLFHILFNMFALWMFGGDIERSWGSREFIKYYLLCGVGAGVINFLISINSPYPVIGASGAIYGLLVAYAMMFPNRLIFIYGLFPIKAKYLVIGFAALEFFASWANSNDGVAHFAHLGGMLVGYIYLKGDWRLRSYLSKLKSLKFGFSRKKTAKKGKRGKREEEILAKVDAVLDKINLVGYHNLTSEEKKILSEASDILAKRKE